MLSRFVDAPQRSYRQRRIHGRRQALAGKVADVHASRAVGEQEIIQVIATDEGGRLKFVGDRMARASSSSSSRSFSMESKSSSGAAIGMVMSRGEDVPGEGRLK
jgi:hypothetical protein